MRSLLSDRLDRTYECRSTRYARNPLNKSVPCDEVEEIVKAGIAGIPRSPLCLTPAEAEQITRSVVSSIPLKAAPADYTMFFVDNAISRYENHGIDANGDGAWVNTAHCASGWRSIMSSCSVPAGSAPNPGTDGEEGCSICALHHP